MAIYLVQHGKSLPKDQDPEKGISEEGRSDSKRIAGVAEGYKVNVHRIVHSGKKRAAQTAAIFADRLKPPSGVGPVDDINPLDDIHVTAAGLDPSSNLMIVGHLPHLEQLTSWLVSGQTDHAVFRFQNSGIVCLDKTTDSDLWSIQWTLMPKIG